MRGYVEDSLHPETAKVLSDAEDEMFANFADVQTTLQSLQDQITKLSVSKKNILECRNAKDEGIMLRFRYSGKTGLL